MRKISVFLVFILVLSLVVGTVSAAEAPSMSANATVAADGSCQVFLALTIHLDSPTQKMAFPIPAGATGIRVNGNRAATDKDSDVVWVDLSKFVRDVVGDVSVNIQYELYGLVKETEIGTLQLELPLLSGFEYPISSMQFSVTLPGAVETLPAFSSGYHQAAIEQHLTYEVNGTTISGSSLKAMKDHETLVMTLTVDEKLFPRVVVDTQSTLTAQIGIAVCGALALLYWLLVLRFIPRPTRCTEPPEGFHAGQMGCIMGSGGIDLTMTVLTWAQLGYVLIHPDRRGKVMLHKRMDMGNERSEQEQRLFRSLFGSRGSVDATGKRYADLSAGLNSKRSGVNELYHRFAGNPLVFRVLCLGIGAFGGGGIGAVMGSGAALQGFLIFLFGALGFVSGWLIPGWTDSGLFRHKDKVILGWGLAAFWMLMALLAGCPLLGAELVVILLVFGVLYGWAGLRTDLGKRTACQVLGLRRYLRGRDREQLKFACQNDPNYFFRLIPYALALGVGKAFAKAMGKEKLEGCTYLTTGMDGHLSAMGWYELIVRTVDAMDARQKSRFIEKAIQFINKITKP